MFGNEPSDRVDLLVAIRNSGSDLDLLKSRALLEFLGALLKLAHSKSKIRHGNDEMQDLANNADLYAPEDQKFWSNIHDMAQKSFTDDFNSAREEVDVDAFKTDFENSFPNECFSDFSEVLIRVVQEKLDLDISAVFESPQAGSDVENDNIGNEP